MTPEGKVKSAIREALAEWGPLVYDFWPVPTGYGKRTLDVLGVFCGVGFAIEAKRPGKDLTVKQAETRDQILAAGGYVFKIDSVEGVEQLRVWMKHVHTYRTGILAAHEARAAQEARVAQAAAEAANG
jgi:hypothetical protein